MRWIRFQASASAGQNNHLAYDSMLCNLTYDKGLIRNAHIVNVEVILSNQRSREPARKGNRNRPNQLDPTKRDGKGSGDVGGSSTGNSGGMGSGGSSPSTSSFWKPLAVLAGAAGIAVAGFFAFDLGGPAADNVSDTENQSRVAAYQTLAASPGLPLTIVAGADIDKAIGEMPDSVTPEQREQLRADINQGRVKLAWVTLWDTHAEDGDVLRFESTSSFPIEVMALNAKTTIAIPYPADGNVVVTGVVDGGGGITIALESGATTVAWPTMAPGDTLNLPVTVSY